MRIIGLLILLCVLTMALTGCIQNRKRNPSYDKITFDCADVLMGAPDRC